MNDAERGRCVETENIETGLLFCPLDAVARDPLIGAIGTYRREMATYNRLATMGEGDDLQTLADRTYRKPLRVIACWNRAATSTEGAIAALRLADQATHDGDAEIAGPMLRAALSYFEKTL
ncbi:hypothetical protein [Sinorhizobium americanum]|uniref:Uncharacterized protein n=1 Tax=Sinorhizobium americanum TaxID=194963 RepID=A0A4R2BRH7_9HYPH|nr:hypothetical protein [Sinorhizobium americanum]TCN30308.1 hypothetical protein EV184_108182 [Sinorhizobium americanum]